MTNPLTTLISIVGIRASGQHGANEGERVLAQEFVVDVQAWVQVGGDSLAATVDYRTLVQTARRTVESTSFVLLESLAEAVATALYQLEPVFQVTATVHKPGAARSQGVGDVSAEVTISE